MNRFPTRAAGVRRGARAHERRGRVAPDIVTFFCHRYDVRYFDDGAVETHVAWRHLAAFDARLLDSSSSDADSDASSEGASVDDPVAEAVRELAKAVARDPVASVVADLRRQAFVAEPADIAFDPAAAAAVRDILRRHGDFVLDLVIVPLLLIKDPACRAYFLGRVAPALAGPFVAPEAAAAAVRGALEATCASLDDADWRRVAKTNVGASTVRASLRETRRCRSHEDDPRSGHGAQVPRRRRLPRRHRRHP